MTTKEYYKKNKDKILKNCNEYYIKNRNKILKKCKEYREKNIKKVKETQKLWKEKNRDKMRVYDREYYKNNKDIINSEKKKEYIKNWKKQNKEKIREGYYKHIKKYNARRKAKKLIPIPKGQLCEDCKINLAEQRHHEDYDKPLEVKLLCVKCHSKLNYK